MHRSSEFNEHVFKTCGEVLSIAGNYVVLCQMMSCTVVIIQKTFPIGFPCCCSQRSYNITLMQKSGQCHLIDLMPNLKPNEVKGLFPSTSVVTGVSWLILTVLLYPNNWDNQLQIESLQNILDLCYMDFYQFFILANSPLCQKTKCLLVWCEKKVKIMWGWEISEVCFPEFVLLLNNLDGWFMEERKLPFMSVLKKRNRRRKSGNINVFLQEGCQIEQNSGFFFLLKYIITY